MVEVITRVAIVRVNAVDKDEPHQLRLIHPDRVYNVESVGLVMEHHVGTYRNLEIVSGDCAVEIKWPKESERGLTYYPVGGDPRNCVEGKFIIQSRTSAEWCPLSLMCRAMVETDWFRVIPPRHKIGFEFRLVDGLPGRLLGVTLYLTCRVDYDA